MSDQHHHGSVEVWDEVFSETDNSYSEETKTQAKLFEIVKIDFLKQIFPPSPAKILEVGSGTGFVSLYFAKRGYSTTLLDTNEAILSVASGNFKKEKAQAQFVVGNAEKLPFESEEFDIVTSFGLLEHFEDPSQVVAEMSRVLKKGGLFFADVVPERFSCQTVGNIFNSFASFLYWLRKGKLWEKMKNKAERGLKPIYYENRLKVADYQKMLDAAGLRRIQVRGNRPFPRLSLNPFLDRFYTDTIKLTLPAWRAFDRWDSPIPLFWGAGWWFWATKDK